MKLTTDAVLLGAWATIPDEGRVLDVGTGSGVLALMTAQRSPEAKITAVEIDPEATETARRNFAASPWADKVEVVQGNIFDLDLGSFDAVVSNPPFYKESLKSPDSRRALARHGGSDFDVLSLIELAPRLLTSDGVLSFIAPVERDDEIQWTAALSRLNIIRTADFRQRSTRPVSRRLYTLSAENLPAEPRSLLTVGDPLYQKITAPFYLDKKK